MKIRLSLLLSTLLFLSGAYRHRAIAGDFKSLEGRVICGYQGWFRAKGDSSGLGWVHYGNGTGFGPGSCTIDMWPDLSEFSASERFPSPFRFEDGSIADLFSSVHPQTVRRHFRWMREYGIDGAFLQRFGTVLTAERQRESADRVLDYCIEAATSEKRSLAVMYDLTNLRPDQFPVIAEDWRQVLARGWTSHGCIQMHAGRPLVALYGLGFAHQPIALSEWRSLIRSIKESGASIFLGIPTHWREAKGDAHRDQAFHDILREADVLSPWTVGRMAKNADIQSIAQHIWGKDLAWCKEAGKGYVPVIFPGFSWHNLSKFRGQEAPLDAIPRQGGRFLWNQAVEAVRAGARTLYVAMFDEIDEGTAVMKCAHRRPAGESPFLDVSDVPSDHYLWLCGQAGRLLRGEIAPSELLPPR